MTETTITIMPTPNPNALKFIANSKVKEEGKATFITPDQAMLIPLVYSLFDVRGIDQIHLFDQAITITKFSYQPWEEIEDEIVAIIKREMPNHDPAFFDPNAPKKRQIPQTPEIEAIEEILDRTIRPGLQADGGDIEIVEFENNNLVIAYQGACGTCPSSTTGTLEAIKSILRNEYDPGIDVFIAPGQEGNPAMGNYY